MCLTKIIQSVGLRYIEVPTYDVPHWSTFCLKNGFITVYYIFPYDCIIKFTVNLIFHLSTENYITWTDTELEKYDIEQ